MIKNLEYFALITNNDFTLAPKPEINFFNIDYF